MVPIGRKRRRLRPRTWLFLVLPAVHAFMQHRPGPQQQQQQRLLPFTRPANTALCGIPGFRAWFEKEFPDAVTTLRHGRGGQRPPPAERFDHVLVDVNHLLHICLRRSWSNGHALVLLMKELDALVALATPTTSLVLAMDGPTSAAKLATQRGRRFTLLRRSEWKQKYLKKIRFLTALQVVRKQKEDQSKVRTLCITPGTEFMEQAYLALQYWAWQRLDTRNNVLSMNNVDIYLSSSDAPGEGEVKLMEWVYHHGRGRRHAQEVIALYGGDSDLVLEALTIPLTVSHNVFVLLPEGNKKTLAVSLWETTRRLASLLPNHNIYRVRTDLVLLLILNGNDYLPKLFGSSGFDQLFKTYITVQGRSPGNLVDPNTLEFDLPFCIAFFTELATLASKSTNLARLQQQASESSSNQEIDSLSKLNNYASAGYLPGPVEFHVIDGKTKDDTLLEADNIIDEFDVDSNGSSTVGIDKSNNGDVLVQLRLGKLGSEDYYVYEAWVRRKSYEIKEAKKRLARIALDDLLDFDENEEDGDDSEAYDDTMSQGYDWQISAPVKCDVSEFLFGLLWNLQTYQDGICADYAFNYGKRFSPTAEDIANFFRSARDRQESVGIKTLSRHPFSTAMTAGASCLAALPLPVKHLVPEPYRLIPDDVVEDIYSKCKSPIDNVFNSNLFQKLCDQQISQLMGNEDSEDSAHSTGFQHSWTVLTKLDEPLSSPSTPPPRFSEKLSELRPSRQIFLGSYPHLDQPCQRHSSDFVTLAEQPSESTHLSRDEIAPFMRAIDSLESVKYKKAYTAYIKSPAPKPKHQRHRTRDDQMSDMRNAPAHHFIAKSQVHGADDKATILKEPPALEIFQSVDGGSAVLYLKQMLDAGLIETIEWKTSPDNADDSCGECELLELTVINGTQTISLKCSRCIQTVSRKIAKQYLASEALKRLTGLGEEWQRRTFSELKGLMS